MNDEHSITKEWMQEMYEQFNQELFENELPDEIKLKTQLKDTNILGCARKGDKVHTITLNEKYNYLPLIYHEDTLIHEMIHIWQFVTNQKDVHGKSFHEKAQEIAILSEGKYRITSTEKLEDISGKYGTFDGKKDFETIKEEKIEKIKEDGPDWKKNLKINLDKDGNPVIAKTLNNVYIMFKEHPKFKGKFNFNLFTAIENYGDNPIEDWMIESFRLQCEDILGYESQDKVNAAITSICHENSFHPFKDKIESLEWDGIERVDDFFIKFVGVDDTQVNRKMTHNWLYGMIKRIYEPGCDFDYMLIVQDEMGGTGKSKIVERLVDVLGLGYGYSSDITADSTNKDNVDKMNRCVVVAFEELADFDKKELPQVKAFISTKSDTARLSYNRRSSNYPRHCVFYGNSNEEFCLNDYTNINESERRFWLMEAHGTRKESKWWKENLTEAYLLQIWAESYYYYLADKNYDVSLSREESIQLLQVQNKHKKIGYEDVLQDKITTVLNRKYPNVNEYGYVESKSTFVSYMSNNDIYTGKNMKYITKVPVIWLKTWIQDYLHSNITTQKLSFMLMHEWEKKPCKINGEFTHCYIRINEIIDNEQDESDNVPF